MHKKDQSLSVSARTDLVWFHPILFCQPWGNRGWSALQTNRPTDQRTDQPTNRPTNWQTDRETINSSYEVRTFRDIHRPLVMACTILLLYNNTIFFKQKHLPICQLKSMLLFLSHTKKNNKINIHSRWCHVVAVNIHIFLKNEKIKIAYFFLRIKICSKIARDIRPRTNSVGNLKCN